MKPTRFFLTESTLSHDAIRSALMAALRAGKPDDTYCYPREVYDDYVIYEEESSQGMALYRRGYTIDGDGNVTLSDASPVKVVTTYEPISEATRVPGLFEAVDGSDGWKWKIQVIQAGTSANGNVYPLPVLHEAVNAYAGVPAFYGRGPDHNPNERGFDSIAGYITSPTANALGIEATLEINRGKPDVREAFLHGYDVAQRTGRSPFGFSHVVPRGGATMEAVQPRGYRVKSITKVSSVDVVVTPAAGGALIAPLSESRDSFVPDPLQEAIVNVAALLSKLKEGKKLGVDELAFLHESLSTEEFAAALAESAQATKPAPPATPAAPLTEAVTPSPAEARLTEAAEAFERRVALAESRALLSEKLAESKLPQKFQDAIRHDYKDAVIDAAALDARIARDRELLAEASAVKPHGLGSVTVTEDQREKQQKAMDGLIWGQRKDGVQPYLTLKEAYLDITGTHFSYIDPDLSRRILQEAITYTGDDSLLKESITTTTFGDVLGDSIRRRLIQEYTRPDRMTWQAIAPSFPVVDFRTFELSRWGGYGFLPQVAQGGTYQPLTSPGDEKATDSLDKYGGLEDLTMEAIANDDMGVVRRIPQKLGYAAVDTVYNAIWNTTIKDNATASYDSTALYDAAHNNTGTAALDESGLSGVRVAMRNQTEYGNATTLPLGEANTPRIIAVPNELEITAYKLTNSAVAITSNANSTEPNFFNNGLRVIVVDSWTDANNWYAFADPSIMPAIQVGFYQGREEPELFVQDAQNVGSMFTADKVTWKIRHIWVVVVVEHRATYRQVVT